MDFCKILEENKYPGRGIAIGRSSDGKAMLCVYFIMGRSENSRNRVFLPTPDGIRTEAFDPAKLADPSLIIYHPVRTHGDDFIVTNGDQTDTIYEALEAGGSFVDALRTRCFEPDGPIFTPRISGMIAKDGSYRLSILKAGDEQGSFSARYFYEYESATPGCGHFIHTYAHDAPTPPSFSGEPVSIAFGADDAQTLAQQVWASLNPDNKVSLYACRIELESQEKTSYIINKHQ